MSGWVLDTNAISAIAPDRPVPSEEGRAWVRANGPSLFLSVMTVAELQSGLLNLERRGASAKAGRLRVWLDGVLVAYAHRILPFDYSAALVAARFLDASRKVARPPEIADIVIAATAEANGLSVATSNRRHFEPFGVTIIDPFTTR